MSAVWTLMRDWQQQGRLRRVDVALAEAAFQAVPQAPPAVLLGLALCSRALADGHVAIPATMLPLWFEDEMARDADAEALHQELRAYLQTGETPLALLRAEHGMLALQAYALGEQALAQAVAERAARPSAHDAALLDALLARLFPNDVIDAPIMQACRDSAIRALTLLSGGPGTGKTTAIARMVALHNALGVTRIGLAAPTGKAAARLQSALSESEHLVDATVLPTAQTVHRLLGLREDGQSPRYDAAHPLPVDLLILDEASMLDLRILRAVFDALPDQANLVLVGDVEQLPSVEAGSVLRALCEAPGLPHHRLRQVHRQREDSAILSLAEAVRAGDVDAALGCLDAGNSELRWHADPAPADIVADALPHFLRIRDADSIDAALRSGADYRLLCAARVGRQGTRALNHAITQAMGGMQEWFEGRWCLIERNEHALGLFNGDLGLCRREDGGVLRVWFAGTTANRAFDPAQLGEPTDAFALSVHKAQGSEFETLGLVLPDADSPLLTREWLYTAITRARRGLTVYASEAALRQAILTLTRRCSSLPVRLHQALSVTAKLSS